MESTTDSIRPRDSDLIQGDMSYLYGRDPSILAYSQRPGPSLDTKKNLYSLYEIEESMHDVTSDSINNLSSQTVKVYLRLKPFSRNAKLTEQQENAYRILSSNILLTKLPATEHLSVSMLKSSTLDIVCRKYTFTETFGPEITQLQFFDQAVKVQMSEFISGQNCTIMTYGTTNSGKSYTLQGTTTSPGIIPRGLEYVFANINPKITPSYKPIHNCDVISLSQLDREHELEIKNKILAFGLTDKNQYINAYKQMQKLLKEESSEKIDMTSNVYYSVWVSFAEIYNETIYDLLYNDCQKRRPSLKLATDSNGRAFIKGLKTVCVNSGSEAFQVLMAGQYNLKVAATALNSRSSRSHCIFTIKLLKYHKENDPESVEMSTFSFCDLAGSERLKKTLNVGDRLKEAQNINSSLLVLGRCLKSIYDGQSMKSRNDVVGPFRESKLTRLFQQALSGKEQISLIVNVNPSPNLYVETKNVLNFAAIAKKIILQPKKIKRRKSKSRFSQVVEQHSKSVIDWDDTAELDSIPEQSLLDSEQCPSIQSMDYEDLLNQNERLQREISALKSSALNRDFEIRQEMANTYTEMLKKVEDHYKNQLKNVEEQQEDLMEYNVNRVEAYWKAKLNSISNRKRHRSDFDDDADEEDIANITELESENAALQSKITSYKTIIKTLRKQKDIAETAKNTAEYELSLVKDNLKRVEILASSLQKDIASSGQPIQCIEELKKQIAELNEKNKTLKDYLNEAKQDYIEVKSEIEMKDRKIDEHVDMIIEQTEKLQDLENQFENTNSVLSERIRYIDELEEKLERKTEQLIDAENRIAELEDAQKNVGNNEVVVKMNESSCQIEIVNELKEKLKNCEDEKAILSEKLSRRSSEIKSLKHDLKLAQNYVTDLDAKLNELKIHYISKNDLPQTNSLQSNIKIKKEQLEYCDGDCQTTSLTVTDQTNQTSFIDTETDQLNNKLTDTEKELENIKNDYNTLEEKFNNEKKNASELMEQLNGGKEINEKLSNEIQVYKERVNKLENDIEISRNSESCQENIVHMLQKEAISNATKCQVEHIEQIETLNKQLLTAQQAEILHEELIDKYRTDINELKEKHNEIQSSLKNKISELDCKLEKLQSEKIDLENKLQDNLQKIDIKNREFEELMKKLQEKDLEISHLQKEIKNILQSTVNDENTMEKELKKVLKELDDTKEMMSSKAQLIEKLQCQLTEFEVLKNTQNDYNRQILEMQNSNKILQNALDSKDQDMEKFKQNRDELIAKYETSLETAQEELNRLKQENAEFQELLRTSTTTPRNVEKNQKFQVPSDDRSHYKLRENRQPRDKGESSDNEVVVERRGRRNRKPLEPPMSPNTDEIAVIELSGSESKRTIRNTAVRTVTSEKRSTRKKKLFMHGDDSYTEIIPPSPVSSRSLRTRRK